MNDATRTALSSAATKLMLAFSVVMLAVSLGILAVAVVTTVTDRPDSTQGDAARTRDVAVAADETDPESAADTASDTTEPAVITTPSDTAATSTEIDDPPPESRAVISNGQIVLEGAVPTQADADEIAALAAEVLGPDNVVNDYVVDPDADDPDLGNITVLDTVNFRPGGSGILPEAIPLLTQGLVLLEIRPAMTITIVGHTDDQGTEEANLALSTERAESVARWFIDRGVDPDRLETRGEGESRPIADNDTEEGRQLNRRIQFFLTNVLG